MGNAADRDSEDEDEPVYSRQGSDGLWKVSKFFDDEEDLFLTEFEHEHQNPVMSMCVERSIEVLRQIRHPNIVKYLSSTTESGKLYMLTEFVVPAKVALEKMSSVEAVVGLKDVAKGLDFMLNRLGIAHNNLHLGAVFVGDTSQQWKLAGMEASTDPKKIDAKFLSSLASIRASDATPPEDKSPAPSKGEPRPQARDVWALGQLVLAVNEELKEDDALPEDLVEYAHTVLSHEDPSRRPTVQTFLRHPTISTDFSKVFESLTDFTIKTEVERGQLCKRMLSSMMSFPEEAVCHRLLPVLLTPPVMADPCMAPVWDSILIPKSEDITGHKAARSGFFSERCFQTEVLPMIGDLLHSRQNHIRLILLRYFGSYARLFPLEDLEEGVLPEVLIGLREEDKHLVAETLRALATIVMLLGSETVMGAERSAVFSDSLPRDRLQPVPSETPPMRSVSEYSHASSNPQALLRDDALKAEREERKRRRKEEQELRRQTRQMRQKSKGSRVHAKLSLADDDVVTGGNSPEGTRGGSHSPPTHSTDAWNDGEENDWKDFDDYKNEQEETGWTDFGDNRDGRIDVDRGGGGSGGVQPDTSPLDDAHSKEEGQGWGDDGDDDEVWEDFDVGSKTRAAATTTAGWRDVDGSSGFGSRDSPSKAAHNHRNTGSSAVDFSHQNGWQDDNDGDGWQHDNTAVGGKLSLDINKFNLGDTEDFFEQALSPSSTLQSPGSGTESLNASLDRVSLSSYTSGALLQKDPGSPAKKTSSGLVSNQLGSPNASSPETGSLSSPSSSRPARLKGLKLGLRKSGQKEVKRSALSSPSPSPGSAWDDFSSPQSTGVSPKINSSSKKGKAKKSFSKQPEIAVEPDFFAGMEPNF